MKRTSSPRSLSLSHHLYRALLVAYPGDFRAAHGAEMAQVFRTACRQTLSAGGAGALAEFWLRTLLDLAVTAGHERVLALRRGGSLPRVILALVALVVACLARYLHSQMDADGTALYVVLAGAVLWGAVWPHRGWRRLLLIASGIVALVVVGYNLSLSGLSSPDFDAPSPLMSLQLLLGGYAGALLSWAVARWKGRSATVWG